MPSRGGLSAEFSPDRKKVITASSNNTEQIWDVQSGKTTMEPMKHDTQVSSAKFSADGKWLVTTSGNSVRVWSAQNGKPVTSPLTQAGTVISAKFSPDGKRIAIVSFASPSKVNADGQWTQPGGTVLRIWDAQTGKPLTEPWEHREWLATAD